MPQFRGGAALEYLEREYGGTMRDYEEVVLVSGATIQIVSGDADRVFLAMVNLGTVAVMVSPTQPVSAARGIRLGGGGGIIAFNVRDDGLMPVVQWHAMTTLANQPLYIVRVRRETLSPPTEG